MRVVLKIFLNKRLSIFLVGLFVGTIIINKAGAELFFYIEAADKYNRMVYKNASIDTWKYGAYLLIEKMQVAIILIVLYSFVHNAVLEYILFGMLGIIFGVTIGGYTIIYGSAGLSKSFLLLGNYAFYLMILLILTRYGRRRGSTVALVLIFICLYVALTTIMIKNGVIFL